jgi:hypothetical protein
MTYRELGKAGVFAVGRRDLLVVESSTALTTSAKVMVEIMPEELTVKYQLQYGPGATPYEFSTPEITLGQCDGTAMVLSAYHCDETKVSSGVTCGTCLDGNRMRASGW